MYICHYKFMNLFLNTFNFLNDILKFSFVFFISHHLKYEPNEQDEADAIEHY